MTFLEFWGESVDPGERGSVEVSGQHEQCRWRLLVWARVLFLLVALPIIWGVGATQMTYFSFWEALGLSIGGTCLYVGLAFFVRPEPNMDNIGFMAGLVNHPGRWSDDWNRSLLNWAIMLGPGRFVAESLIDFVLLFQEPAKADQEPLPSNDDWSQAENLAALDERRFTADV
ncbi:MAG: hypothetical protein AB7O62_16180 [Pirellulales bacterium]